MLNGRVSDDDSHILAIFERLAIEAGRALITVREQGFSVRSKSDESPVTEADIAAENVIRAGLAEHLAAIPVVAEESIADGRIPTLTGEPFILVDAMDGTREFIAGRPDFTVNIALVRDGAPAIGVVLAPAHRQMYSGQPGRAECIDLDFAGQPGARRPIAVAAPRTPPRILASRSHRTPETDAFLKDHAGAEIVAIGSSLKFCLLAAGQADLYPRFGTTMQWDTAAGDAVLRAAGGITRDLDGSPLTYRMGEASGTAAFANPWFIAEARA